MNFYYWINSISNNYLNGIYVHDLATPQIKNNNIVVAAFNERAKDPELAISVAAILVYNNGSNIKNRQWMII